MISEEANSVSGPSLITPVSSTRELTSIPWKFNSSEYREGTGEGERAEWTERTAWTRWTECTECTGTRILSVG